MLFLSLRKAAPVDERIDGVELCLDAAPELLSFREHIKIPVLFKFGRLSDDSSFVLSALKRKPDYIDLSYGVNSTLIHQIYNEYPSIRIILSYHNERETPAEINSILEQMRSSYVYGYKIATYAHSILDALRMLLFIRKYAHSNVTGICMGTHGSITRILGPIFGSLMGFAHQGEPTASGQLSVSALLDFYHYQNLRLDTAIYGLIGGEVEQSLSPFIHNPQMKNRNAVYVNMSLQAKELSQFFSLAKDAGIKGLSVTMPFKESILPYLDHTEMTAGAVRAVNTLTLQQGLMTGWNTDAKAALDAIESAAAVKGKKFVLIGAGGAARAIAYEALSRGADLLVLNRTPARAQLLHHAFGALSDVPSHYDVIVNATSCDIPIEPSQIIRNTVVMDIQTKMTTFLKEAQAKGCQIVFGYDMLLRQADAQQAIWFRKS